MAAEAGSVDLHLAAIVHVALGLHVVEARTMALAMTALFTLLSTLQRRGRDCVASPAARRKAATRARTDASTCAAFRNITCQRKKIHKTLADTFPSRKTSNFHNVLLTGINEQKSN